MASRNPFSVDVRGELEVHAQLALLELTTKKRRRLLNKVGLRVRTQWRKRVREQKDLDGSPFAPRKSRRKGQKARMLTGLSKFMGVSRLTGTEAELGWTRRKTAVIAGAHNAGATMNHNARPLQPAAGMASEGQARRLRRLGFKVRLPRKSKKGKARWMRPTVAWITENINSAQAGLLIRVLSKKEQGQKSWQITLPKREFFGIAGQQEVSELIAYLLPQIINSPE